MNKEQQLIIIDTVTAILSKENVFVDDTDYLESVSHQIGVWHSVLEKQDDASHFYQKWNNFLETILLSPQWFSFLFPQVVTTNTNAMAIIKTLQNNGLNPPHKRHEIIVQKERWLAEQSNITKEDSLISYLHAWLLHFDPSQESNFLYLSVYSTYIDALYGCFVKPEIKAIQNVVLRHHYHQFLNWENSYCNGYPYQGYIRIGIRGIKPTETRINKYEVDSYFAKDKEVLDIGSNAGFMAIYFSELCHHVDAVEYNPYLCMVGQSVADELNVNNVSFIENDFYEYLPDKTYDIIFSLANHATIDRNLSINFEEYIAKIYGMLNKEGILFFESHNVYGPGSGEPGDDGDLNDKFDIVERYFTIENFKMTQRFVENDDIDKLFVILKRRQSYKADAVRTFELDEARRKYEYSDM